MSSKNLTNKNYHTKVIKFSKALRRDCIIILGLQNSGANAIEEGFQTVYNLKFKNKEVLNFQNEKKEISFLNSHLLVSLGLTWDSVTELPDSWKNGIDQNKDRERLKSILLNNFNYDGPIIINDSKIILLLPLWLDLFQELKFNVSFVIAHRNPFQIAASFKTTENISANKSFLIYIHNMMYAEKITRKLNRVLIDYNELSNDPRNIVVKSIAALDEKVRPDLDFDSEKTKALLNQTDKIGAINSSNTEALEIEKNSAKTIGHNLWELLQESGHPNFEYSKLDSLYNQFKSNQAAFYKGILSDFNQICKLSIAFKNGEKIVLTKKIVSGRQILSFDLKNYSQIESLSFYPSNELSYIKLGRISTIINEEEQTINFSNFDSILHHSHHYIVKGQNRIFINFINYSNNTPSIDFEITLLASGPTVYKYFQMLSTKKDAWFEEHLERSKLHLCKIMKQTKAIKKEKKKVVKRLKKQGQINSKQNVIINELTLANSKLKTSLTFKSEEETNPIQSKNETLESQIIGLNQVIEKLNGQLANYTAQQERKKQYRYELQLELQKEKEITANLQKQVAEQNLSVTILNKKLNNLTTQLEIEKRKSLDAIEKSKQSFKQLKKLSKKLASKSDQLNLQSKINKKIVRKNKKLKKVLSTLKQEQEFLTLEINQQKPQIESLLETTEKYKNEVTSLQATAQKKDDVIHKQHLEIIKFKTDYGTLENYIAVIKKSKSYQAGRFLTTPFRYIYDKIFDSNLVKSRSWIFLGAFFMVLRYPFKFLKHLNSKNISTLRNAIKNEPPKQILANFKNFLSTGQKKAIGIEHQVEFPNNTNPEYMSKWDTFLKNKQQEKSSVLSRVLYISPELPQFDTSSGGKRATRMLSLLAEEMEVYVYTTAIKSEKYINKLEELGIRVIINPDLDTLRKKISHFDSIIFAWYYTYLESHRLIELYPNAKIIVDTVDVHWVREERSVGNWEGFTAEMAAKNKEGEIYTYQQADIVWAVTDNDKSAIENKIPNKDIRIISNIHTPVIKEYADPQNNTMLFFGGFSHYPNISAVKLLVHKILPHVQKEIPDCKVIIAGSNATQEIEELGKIKGVDFRGFIEEENIDDLYRESFLSVSPLLAGAGIKGKICEAIAYMTPVVTNGIGNEGINLENNISGFIAEEIKDLANIIIKAMKREYDLIAITKSAQEKMAELIGPDIVKERMIASIIPEITICIVTYNRMDLLKRCIESIEGNTKYPRYKIVVHSNGCTDGTTQYLEAASVINKRIIPVISEKNDVFVIPNNNMMMMHDQNDVVLLNNDTYVTNNWLTELYNAAYSSSDIGIAGSKILYPDGKLQEFGSELYENGEGRNIGKWEDPNLDDYQKIKRAGYVSGCSMYIKRSTINQLGVFDLQFHPCYCEDSDYCYTAWENNIQTVVTPNSIVYHDEGATSGTDTSSGFKKYQEVNFKKFLTKHQSKLADTKQKIERLNGTPIIVNHSND